MKYLGKKITILLTSSAILVTPFFVLSSCSQQVDPKPEPRPPISRNLFSIQNSILEGFNPVLSSEQIVQIIGDNILKIPRGVIAIADNAFYKNNASTIPEDITGISFADAVDLQSIGKNAFRKSPLTKFALSQKLATIGEYAFAETSLEYVNLSRNSTIDLPLTIKQNCFSNNEKLSELILGSKITNIEDNAFAENINISSIDLSELTSLPPAWSGTNIFLNSCKDEGIVYAFDEFKSSDLKPYMLSQGINKSVVYNFATTYYEMDPIPDTSCYKITGFMDGSACKRICEDFHTTALPFPSIVTEIGDSAFYANGRSTILSSVTSIAFTENITIIGNEAFKKANITNLSFANGLNYIGESAFAMCPNLQTVKFNKDLKEIDNLAFADCYKDVNLSYDNDVKWWRAVIKGRDWLQGSNQTKIECYDWSCDPCESSTPGNFFKIKHTSSYDYVILGLAITTDVPRELKIPECIIQRKAGTRIYDTGQVTSIADRAFYQNDNIDSVIITDPMGSIGTGAFEQSSLRTITINNNLPSLGEAAFRGCSKLEKFNCRLDEIRDMPRDCFRSCPLLTSLELGYKVRSIGEGFILDSPDLCTLDWPTSKEAWGKVVRPEPEKWHSTDTSEQQIVKCTDGECDFDYVNP